MHITTALLNHLRADTGIAVYVPADSILPVWAAQDTRMPYIIISQIASPGSHTQDGATGIGEPHYQIVTYSSQYNQAHTIAALVKKRLDGFQGVMGGTESDPGVYVHSIFFNDEDDDVTTDPKPEIFFVRQDYYVSYREE
jgi:hypothetical protein